MFNADNLLIKIKVSDNYGNLPLPKYETSGAAGMDLLACIGEDIIIHPNDRILIPTGIFMELPDGVEAQVRPRSGLALKNGITVLNAPGTIDSDYRGEIGVILINLGQESFTVKRGMRIAQLVFAFYNQAILVLENELKQTERGVGGFGHSGLATDIPLIPVAGRLFQSQKVGVI